MTDYIKREDAIKAFDPKQRQDWYTPWIVETLEDLPSADVAPVVRCKDCFLYGECKAAEWYGENGNGYCSVGDRRKDNE